MPKGRLALGDAFLTWARLPVAMPSLYTYGQGPCAESHIGHSPSSRGNPRSLFVSARSAEFTRCRRTLTHRPGLVREVVSRQASATTCYCHITLPRSSVIGLHNPDSISTTELTYEYENCPSHNYSRRRDLGDERNCIFRHQDADQGASVRNAGSVQYYQPRERNTGK